MSQITSQLNKAQRDPLDVAHAQACDLWDKCKDQFDAAANTYSRKPTSNNLTDLMKIALALFDANAACDRAWQDLKNARSN